MVRLRLSYKRDIGDEYLNIMRNVDPRGSEAGRLDGFLGFGNEIDSTA